MAEFYSHIQSTEKLPSNLIYLVDLKRRSDICADKINKINPKLGKRIYSCNKRLILSKFQNGHHAIASQRFCRVKYCVLCRTAYARKNYAIACKAWSTFPIKKWHKISLPCPLIDLDQQTSEIKKQIRKTRSSLQKLSQRKEWMFDAQITCLKVSQNLNKLRMSFDVFRTGKQNIFSKNYISSDKASGMWSSYFQDSLPKDFAFTGKIIKNQKEFASEIYDASFNLFDIEDIEEVYLEKIIEVFHKTKGVTTTYSIDAKKLDKKENKDDKKKSKIENLNFAWLPDPMSDDHIDNYLFVPDPVLMFEQNE